MTFISGESNNDHGPNSVPQSAYNLLHSEYIIEKINHIEALAMIGDEESLEDACEIGNELFPEWESQVFDISGLAYERDGFMQRPNDLDMEFFSCKVTYKNIDIIDDKVHLVFYLEDDIVIDSNTNEEAPLTEIVFPWQNIFSLDQTDEFISLDDSRDFTDPRYLSALATEASIIMRYALDATTADSPADAASFAGETIRAQTEIKEYSEIYENRIMYLSASRWYRVHSGICFDEDLCGVNQTDNLAFPPSGLFSRLVMREEYDPNHKPDETSLCYEL